MKKPKVMTKEQLDAALKVIMADCKLTGNMMDEHGNTCAVAALGLAAGVSKRRVADADLAEWEDRIERKFGIPTDRLGGIMEINDGETTVAKRRKAVATWVKRIYNDEQCKLTVEEEECVPA